jgi:hypothetical protein
MGEQCKGQLRRCRKVRVGRAYRLIYTIRTSGIVVLSVWFRDDLAAYSEAKRALKEPFPLLVGGGRRDFSEGQPSARHGPQDSLEAAVIV